MKNLDKSKKIIRYSYLGVCLIILGTSAYLYLFFKEFVYESIFFDETKYPQTVLRDSSIDMKKFDKVISKIDAKSEANLKKNYINLFR